LTVLLFGSTGRVGPHAARALVRKGQPVRAFVRNAARARQILPAEAEIVEGDLADIGSAATGVSAVLLLTGHGPDMAAEQIGLINQITDESVRIVKISGTSAVIRPDGPDAGRQHYEVEEHLATGANPYVVLRPNAFMQTLVSGMAAGIRASGTVANPLGEAKLSLIDAADIGEAAAETLVNGIHDGNTYVLTGPEATSYREVAATIAAVTGVPAAVVDVDPSAAAAGVRSRGGSDWEAAHLEEMLALFRAGRSEYVTDDVERILGRSPRTVGDYVQEHRREFAGTLS
jgi:uncharacterized protein YbjT (DUF2867 family)